jgi:pyruvate ferredoxin oxidoreductase alpha subunit
MMKKMLTANKAVAWGARLAKPDFIPNFPITPQTEIIEVIAKWLANGEYKTRYLSMESEHSVMSAAVAASAIGARVFTATSSQGLMLMAEMLPIGSGLRAPIVMANVSRGLAAPIVLGPDNNDVLAMRDFGWLQFHCETCQETLDSMLMAFRISEDDRVLLPSIVNLDGFVLSFTREPVEIPDQKLVDNFLPEREPPFPFSYEPIEFILQFLRVRCIPSIETSST